MKITIASVLISLAFAAEISAGLISHPRSHHALARRRSRQKRCISGIQPSGDASASTSDPTSTASDPPAPTQTAVQDNDNGDQQQNSGGGGGGGGGGGTISIAGYTAPCGDPNASPTPTVDNGPNGQAVWLACGVAGSGWQPPPIYTSNVIYIDLESAVGPGQVFNACSDFLDLFNQWGGSTGIPPILLAAIASQESGCDPNVRGPNGEYGLMQITPDKCPVQDNSCLDPSTNIQTGATFFADTVSGGGGNLALALGQYNGWHPGLTENEADSADTCGARNNLDYLHMVLNGFMQGVDPRANPRMGTFFNVDCNNNNN
jgi:hypothetical protein